MEAITIEIVVLREYHTAPYQVVFAWHRKGWGGAVLSYAGFDYVDPFIILAAIARRVR